MVRLFYKIGRIFLIALALTIHMNGFGAPQNKKRASKRTISAIKKSALKKGLGKRAVVKQKAQSVARVANTTDSLQKEIVTEPKLNADEKTSVQLSNPAKKALKRKSGFLSRNKYYIAAGAVGLGLAYLGYHKGLFSKKVTTAALPLLAAKKSNTKPKKEDISFIDKKLFDMKVSWSEAKEIASENWNAAKKNIANWWNNLEMPDLTIPSLPNDANISSADKRSCDMEEILLDAKKSVLNWWDNLEMPGSIIPLFPNSYADLYIEK